jgi:hypothetical protein
LADLWRFVEQKVEETKDLSPYETWEKLKHRNLLVCEVCLKAGKVVRPLDPSNPKSWGKGYLKQTGGVGRLRLRCNRDGCNVSLDTAKSWPIVKHYSEIEKKSTGKGKVSQANPSNNLSNRKSGPVVINLCSDDEEIGVEVSKGTAKRKVDMINLCSDEEDEVMHVVKKCARINSSWDLNDIVDENSKGTSNGNNLITAVRRDSEEEEINGVNNVDISTVIYKPSYRPPQGGLGARTHRTQLAGLRPVNLPGAGSPILQDATSKSPPRHELRRTPNQLIGMKYPFYRTESPRVRRNTCSGGLPMSSLA